MILLLKTVTTLFWKGNIMSNKKISAFPAAGALGGTEIVPVVTGGVNKRTTTQAIANLGGGGGGSSSLIQIANAASFTTIPESLDTLIPMDPTLFGGALYRLQGSDMAWGGAGNETKINVLTNGFYSLHCAIVVTPGTELYGVAMTPYLDGAPVFYTEYGTALVPIGGAAGITARVNFTKLPINAASFVEIHVTQVGNTSNDNGIAGFTAVLTKDA
jgi:hypothetical protein